MTKCVVIVAGGKGSRFGSDIPKQFNLMNNLPVLMHTINAFYKTDNKIKIILTLPHEHIVFWGELCEKYNFKIAHTVVKGGCTRWESVKNGLTHVNENSIVGIHDGVRPLVSSELIERMYAEAELHGAVIPVVNITDSLRVIDSAGKSRAVNRSDFRAVQTPQVFKSEIINAAYNMPYDESFTDDASVVEKFGIEIRCIPGDEKNIKITTSKDLMIAELYCKDA